MRLSKYLLGVCLLAASPAFFKAQAGVLYDNDFGGVFSGDLANLNAWTVNLGYTVSNSFSIPGTGTATITGFELLLWAYPGDSLANLDWYLSTSGPTPATLDGGTLAPLSQVVFNGPGFANGMNGLGFSALDEVFQLPSPLSLTLGSTYSLQIDTANSPGGDAVFWDQSDGPSLANINGSPFDPASYPCGGPCTGSESFRIFGAYSSVPEPGTWALSGLAVFAAALWRRFPQKP